MNLKIPENSLTCDLLNFNKLEFKNIFLNYNKNFDGILNFAFFDGNGTVNFETKNYFSQISGSFLIENINLKKLIGSLNEKILLTGLLNLKGYFNLNEKKIKEFEIEFNSVDKRGIEKYMNFGLIELISSLSETSPVKKFGKSNFYYKKISGKITIKDEYLIIEGLAKEKGDKQYIVIKPFLLPGINLFIDKKNNKILLQEFINRVKIAIDRIKNRYEN